MILQVAPPPPNGWMGQSPFDPAPCVTCIPIDQGVLVLVVIGVVIGVYNLIKEHKKQNNGR